jgi:hypothetical protein
MLRDKPLSHLILILFTGMMGANIIGEALRNILHFIAGEDTIVERALLHYVKYPIGPHDINLWILSFSFGLELHFNVITLLGILIGWYYFRYSY